MSGRGRPNNMGGSMGGGQLRPGNMGGGSYGMGGRTGKMGGSYGMGGRSGNMGGSMGGGSMGGGGIPGHGMHAPQHAARSTQSSQRQGGPPQQGVIRNAGRQNLSQSMGGGGRGGAGAVANMSGSMGGGYGRTQQGSMGAGRSRASSSSHTKHGGVSFYHLSFSCFITFPLFVLPCNSFWQVHCTLLCSKFWIRIGSCQFTSALNVPATQLNSEWMVIGGISAKRFYGELLLQPRRNSSTTPNNKPTAGSSEHHGFTARSTATTLSPAVTTLSPTDPLPETQRHALPSATSLPKKNSRTTNKGTTASTHNTTSMSRPNRMR